MRCYIKIKYLGRANNWGLLLPSTLIVNQAYVSIRTVSGAGGAEG